MPRISKALQEELQKISEERDIHIRKTDSGNIENTVVYGNQAGSALYCIRTGKVALNCTYLPVEEVMKMLSSMLDIVELMENKKFS